MTAAPRERRPPTLDDPVDLAGVRLRNRLYRAPVLECAGNGDDAVDRLIDDLEPAAAAGAGLIQQGATIVTGRGGCAAPGMTRVHDPDFVADLARLTDAVHAHGSRIAIQLEHGGLRSMEVWHDAYGRANPDLHQLAVSRPPRLLHALDRLGFLDLSPRVMTTAEVESLVDDFARAAARAVDAGYDAIHIAGANMGIVQQFLSPFYNRREDRFGIDPRVGPEETPGVGIAFLERLGEAIRDRAGDVPLLTKVPSERPTLPGIGPHLSDDDAVATCERLAGADGPFDAVVPVRTSVFWDMSVVRGEFPASAWQNERFRDGFREAFGSLPRAAAVAAGTGSSHWFTTGSPAGTATSVDGFVTVSTRPCCVRVASASGRSWTTRSLGTPTSWEWRAPFMRSRNSRRDCSGPERTPMPVPSVPTVTTARSRRRRASPGSVGRPRCSGRPERSVGRGHTSGTERETGPTIVYKPVPW